MTQRAKDIDIEALREVFSFDPYTGTFTYRVQRGAVTSGSKAGSLHRTGYIALRLNGRSILAHRAAWAMHFNEQPPINVDHVNCDRADNRISNLRPATPEQNQGNRLLSSNNTSGQKGVIFNKRLGKYVAQIRSAGRCKHLGVFDDIETARMAYSSAAQAKFGIFSRIAV